MKKSMQKRPKTGVPRNFHTLGNKPSERKQKQKEHDPHENGTKGGNEWEDVWEEFNHQVSVQGGCKNAREEFGWGGERKTN